MSKLSKGSVVNVRGHFPPKETGFIEKVHVENLSPEPLYTVQMKNGTKYVKIEGDMLKEAK